MRTRSQAWLHNNAQQGTFSHISNMRSIMAVGPKPTTEAVHRELPEKGKEEFIIGESLIGGKEKIT